MTPEFRGSFSSRGDSPGLGRPTGSSSLSRDQAQAPRQVDGRLSDGQFLTPGPQVQGIALGAAARIETLENVPVDIHREASSFGARWLVNRARAATLASMALQFVPGVQLAQYLFYADPFA